MKTALVMEGGAMRGMFTCGVLDVFLENGVEFDAAGGISAGAAFGCNFISRQRGRAIRYNKKYCNDENYCSVRSLIKTGDLYGADFCYRELPDVLDPFDRKAFAENTTEFYVGATDTATGKPVYHKCSDGGERDFAWIRASASMPFVSHAVVIDGYTLLDGGICDATPFDYLKSIGYERFVVILTRPRGYIKKKSPSALFSKLLLRRYPEIAKALAIRHERYNAEMLRIARSEEAGEALVLAPCEPLDVKRSEHDPEKLQRAYDTGAAEAREKLDEIRAFLQQSKLL
ncbi:MAG: patatin family protein [Clostridia bacterium]|nr:patatin family protein [Clostridia bacterium]MBP5237395.1 patatin family protein [Clostridia bacterium]MBP5657956.1 patatin family protein [Clostridia bacterium]